MLHFPVISQGGVFPHSELSGAASLSRRNRLMRPSPYLAFAILPCFAEQAAPAPIGVENLI